MYIYIYIHAMNVMFAENSCLLSLARWYALVRASTSTSSCPSSCGHMYRCRFGLNLGRRRCHRWKRYFFGYIPWPLQLHFFIQHHPPWPINFWSYTNGTPSNYIFLPSNFQPMSWEHPLGEWQVMICWTRWSSGGCWLMKRHKLRSQQLWFPFAGRKFAWCCWNDLRKHLCEFDHDVFMTFSPQFLGWNMLISPSTMPMMVAATETWGITQFEHLCSKQIAGTPLSKTIGLGILGGVE